MDAIEYALYVPNTVPRWPEDGFYIGETCHIINCKPCRFMSNVVFVDGMIYHTFDVTQRDGSFQITIYL
jgi:hypothetical protein